MAGVSRRGFLASVATGGLAAISAGQPGPEPASRPLPRSGRLEDGYEAVEGLVLEHAARRGVTACALGISAAGRVVVDRAYGWGDYHRTHPAAPTSQFRIASVSKILTRAAVCRLIRAGRLSMDDPMLENLDVEVPPDADPRLADVTVGDLVHHCGGWDRCETFDPMFASRRIAREMGLSHPPSRREIISYMFSRPLCFAPGTRSAYSNFGYAVLGTIVENRTGMDFDTYVDSAILDPIDADLRPGHTLPADRYPREVWYGDWEFSPSAVDVDALVPVRRPDGGFYLEAMDANSGYVATARDLLRVLDTFWLSGEPRCEVPFAPGAIYGALSGTYALAYQPTPSIDVVVLCNRFPTEPWALARRIRDSLPGAGRAIGPHPVA